MNERRYFLTWLIIITIIACTLRVYHLTDIPFIYDELSAMHRTHYGSFGDLIKYGVAPDGHPAGVQVFLFYWSKLVGDAEWLIKLPFILMGICCIPLIYRIGSRWFSRDAGIVAAGLIACLQYTVMYSQIVRPYISGLFLVLLLVVVWNEVMIKITRRNMVAYAILLALCAYNHYFSLLMAGCIVLTGFFVIGRRELVKYALSVILAVVLFVPHISLFFTQLELKGLGWMSAPNPGFFKYYLNYVFNFSPWVIGAVVFFVVQGICISIRQKDFGEHKYRIIALLWFVVPAATGYFYSVFRAPVLETSGLIFSFPFLVLFICSFVKLPRSWFRSVQIAALLLVLTTSLIYGRNYYSIFYHQETEMFAKHISGYGKAYGNNQVAAVIKTESSYLNYYKSKYNTGWTFQTFDSIGGNVAWRKWLQNCNAQYLILGNPPVEWAPDYLPIAEEYFKCVDSIYYGFTTSIYILKRNGAKCDSIPAPFVITMDNADTTRARFHKSYVTGYGETVYQVCDSLQAGGVVPLIMHPEAFSDDMKISISVDFYVDSIVPDGYLFLRFAGKNGMVDDRRSLFNQSISEGDKGWHSVYLTTRFWNAPRKESTSILADMMVGPHPCFKFKNFKVKVEHDNPVLYWIVRN